MPTSDHHNISPILTLVTNLRPNRILDIGCGFGKYGVLFREYLDVWHERLRSDQWQVHIAAIEAFYPYTNPIHQFVYNEVHYGEAQAVMPTLGEFDAILIADVIEHLQKEDALKLVERCLDKGRVLIISTPREFYAQKDILNNTYEVHRTHWGRSDFPENIYVKTIRACSCDVFVASRQPLHHSLFQLTTPADHIYLRSRMRLGLIGLPLSLALRAVCRWLS